MELRKQGSASASDNFKEFMKSGKKEQDPEKKKVLEKAFYETDIPNFFALVVKLLEGNGGKHMVGNEVNSHCRNFSNKLHIFDA